MLHLEPGLAPHYEFQPIAPLCYQTVSVDLTGIDDATKAGILAFDAIEALTKEASFSYSLVRVELTGRTRLGPERHARFEELREQQHSERWSIERVNDQTRPEVDLEVLARDPSPPGAVARMLLSLDSPAIAAPLLERTRAEIASIQASSAYSPIRDIDAPDERQILEQSAWKLLEILLAQQEVTS
jgi:hypothetical protein